MSRGRVGDHDERVALHTAARHRGAARVGRCAPSIALALCCCGRPTGAPSRPLTAGPPRTAVAAATHAAHDDRRDGGGGVDSGLAAGTIFVRLRVTLPTSPSPTIERALVFDQALPREERWRIDLAPVIARLTAPAEVAVSVAFVRAPDEELNSAASAIALCPDGAAPEPQCQPGASSGGPGAQRGRHFVRVSYASGERSLEVAVTRPPP